MKKKIHVYLIMQANHDQFDSGIKATFIAVTFLKNNRSIHNMLQSITV